MTEETTLNIPNHIAIVPDGNRRWARNKNMEPQEGHLEGAKRIEEIVQAALDLGVKNISFWGSSVNNLTKRPLKEKMALLKVYEEYFKKLISDKRVFEKEARINIVGRWREQFPEKLKKILEGGILQTKSHSKHFLNFLLAYNGGDDMLHAVKSIARKVKNSADNFEISEETIQNSLITSDLPKVDLLIRTGVDGDPHNSVGFLMWQIQNSQYYFSEKMMPEFGVEDFKTAIEDFADRERRLGK